MQPASDHYQTDLSKQPAGIERHIRRGEAFGRFLLRLSGYLHRLYRTVHPAAEASRRREQQRTALPGASAIDVKRDEHKAASAQQHRTHAANDEHYKKSVA
jgi:hypothetical protein